MRKQEMRRKVRWSEERRREENKERRGEMRGEVWRMRMRKYECTYVRMCAMCDRLTERFRSLGSRACQ
jgi:hypothetical protein